MSPEQVEGKPLDPRSDIYSLGVTCYHMLAGQPPFHGDTALNVAVQHLKGKADDLADLRPDLPPALCRLIHKMFARKLEDRCTSAQELLGELRAIAAASGLMGDLEVHLPTGSSFVAAPTTREAVTQLLQVSMSAAPPPRSALRWWLLAVAGVRCGVCDRPGRGRDLLRPAPLLEPRPGRTRQGGRGQSGRGQALALSPFCIWGQRLRPNGAICLAPLHFFLRRGVRAVARGSSRRPLSSRLSPPPGQPRRISPQLPVPPAKTASRSHKGQCHEFDRRHPRPANSR